MTDSLKADITHQRTLISLVMLPVMLTAHLIPNHLGKEFSTQVQNSLVG